ncbi:hypothetical protein [Streptomyces sp. NPDC004065]|uniref:hypothetical protein n=1 Tax=Streptomyces sp. NPDC004065 TaxID=3364689 RepID=UPI00384ED3F3
MSLSHALQQGVLVITVHDDPGTDERSQPASRIADLLQAYRPASVVVVLDRAAVSPAVVGAVLDAHRLCDRLGAVMAVATHDAPARRRLEAGAAGHGTRLVVHARVDVAIAGAAVIAAAAQAVPRFPEALVNRPLPGGRWRP